MPRTLPFNTAKNHLQELVEGMAPGEEPVLTWQGKSMAIVARSSHTSWPCQPGSAKSTKPWMAPDFDALLEDFKEYIE
jgi:hypothetical protein